MFTKDTMRSFRSDFQNTVAELEKKYNVKIDLGNIAFDSGSFKSSIKAVSLDPVAQAVKAASFNPQIDSYASMMGIKFNSHFIGQSYLIGGKKLTVSDYQSRKSKYPVICKGDDGKSYKVSFEMIKTASII